MLTADTRLSPEAAVAWYRKNRERTSQLFALLTDDAYYDQPISLRHPIVFYEGHIPAFSLNTLVKKALGKPGIDERLERLFARGIDPDEHDSRTAAQVWPSRDEVRAFVAEADRLVLEALSNEPLEIPGHTWLDGADAVFTILEHEAMHQETLLYMWHRLPHAKKRAPRDYSLVVEGKRHAEEFVDVTATRVRLGVDRHSVSFGWDNEFGELVVDVGRFRVCRNNITNAQFLEFVESGGYEERRYWSEDDFAWVREQSLRHPTFWERNGSDWRWRGMFETVPLPPHWPVYVSHAEASAYANWRGKRLLTEPEYHALTTPFPRPSVHDFVSWEPHPVGSHPDAANAQGINDLVGNGWEWTSTIFRPFPGFKPSASYPEYSADFFDASHYVMKGASPVTARELVRPSFRNWFRPRYPYVYATFRLAETAA